MAFLVGGKQGILSQDKEVERSLEKNATPSLILSEKKCLQLNLSFSLLKYKPRMFTVVELFVCCSILSHETDCHDLQLIMLAIRTLTCIRYCSHKLTNINLI